MAVDILGRSPTQFLLADAVVMITWGRLAGDGPATTASLLFTCAIVTTFQSGWAGLFAFRN